MTDSPRRVLVTGASRGIGRAVAVRLALDGFEIAGAYRTGQAEIDGLLAEVRAAGGQANSIRFDAADRMELRDAIGSDVEERGPYYGVVCNAGISRDNAFPLLTDEDWDAVIDTNLGGTYNVLSACVMPMIRRRKPGRIVTIASVSGIMGNRGQTNYSAAKAGIIGLTKALAVELAGRNITVNCVAPGLIETDMTTDLPMLEEMLKAIPARRMGTPAEVASVVAFLMSDEASYVTRQVISVNGGLC